MFAVQLCSYVCEYIVAVCMPVFNTQTSMTDKHECTEHTEIHDILSDNVRYMHTLLYMRVKSQQEDVWERTSSIKHA